MGKTYKYILYYIYLGMFQAENIVALLRQMQHTLNKIKPSFNFKLLHTI